jgi:hypothetical protein
VIAPVTSAGLIGDRWVSFDAVDASPYELARYWGERGAWPVEPRRTDELRELAVMSRLADWLLRWQPILIHRAVLAGAGVGDVSAAAGVEAAVVVSRWRRWAQGQRRLYESNGGPSPAAVRLGLGPDEFDRVAGLLGFGAYGPRSCLDGREPLRNLCLACAEDRPEDCSVYGPEAES